MFLFTKNISFAKISTSSHAIDFLTKPPEVHYLLSDHSTTGLQLTELVIVQLPEIVSFDFPDSLGNVIMAVYALGLMGVLRVCVSVCVLVPNSYGSDFVEFLFHITPAGNILTKTCEIALAQILTDYKCSMIGSYNGNL